MLKQIGLKSSAVRVLLVLVLSICVLAMADVKSVYADSETLDQQPVSWTEEEPGEDEPAVSISDAEITGILASYDYTGSAITPEPTVKIGTTVLAKDTDYNVSYSNNTEAGTATVTITGIGAYEGTKSVDFQIVPKGWYWSSKDGEWYYYRDGSAVTDTWIKAKSGWCWMDGSGKLTRNRWIQSGGAWYYLNADGYMAANQWVKTSGVWYFVDANGKMQTNQWKKSNGKWYYLKNTGAMAANQWIKASGGWCWMGSDGVMAANKWIKTGGAWYYLKSDGYMAANQWVKAKGGWCWMSGSGAMVANKWIKTGGAWYYLKSDGYMAAGQWAKSNGKWCYLQGTGKMAADKWLKTGGHWYYLDSNGYMRTDPYIFISIDEQTLYYYKDGSCYLKTPVVTGKLYGIKYHGTPTGNYRILSKQRNTHLKGLEDDGKTKYDSFVRYWMPFRGDGYGLHDADWRGSFGGTIYKYYGSHGCVNMPVSAAGKLYNLITVGTFVRIQ